MKISIISQQEEQDRDYYTMKNVEMNSSFMKRTMMVVLINQ